MATSPACPRCGFINQPGYQFCTNCGGVLAATPGAPVPAAYPGVYPPGYGMPPPYEYERRKQIDRTKTGVLLLLIGTLVGAVPVVGALGALVVLIGAIFVILGRKAFGTAHARNVVVSIIVVVVGFLVSAAGGVIAVFTALGPILANASESEIASALESAFALLLYLGVASAAIMGIGSVLFTYMLQQQKGRLLLWAGYGAEVALAVALVVLFSPDVPAYARTSARDIVLSADKTTALSLAVANFGGRLTILEYLGAIPALLFAAANYLAWSRINRGEIPAPPTAPAVPPATPP